MGGASLRTSVSMGGGGRDHQAEGIAPIDEAAMSWEDKAQRG